jgi:hypothetical protein
MGYRSTVAYTIRFVVPDDEKTHGQVRDSFYTFLAEAKSKDDTALCFSEEELEYLEIDEKNMTMNFFADSVKWYDSYPAVMCHEALMELSKEWADESETSNPYISGAFARIGEEMEDNIEEVWGQGEYDWISINRYMYCDWKE